MSIIIIDKKKAGVIVKAVWIMLLITVVDYEQNTIEVFTFHQSTVVVIDADIGKGPWCSGNKRSKRHEINLRCFELER